MNIIIICVMLSMAITPLVYASYNSANEWDTDTAQIEGMIRNTPAPTTVKRIYTMEVNMASPMARVNHPELFPMEDMVDACMPDPQPFNWDSKLHMMLPDDFYALIMATEDDLIYTNTEDK